MPTPTPTPTPSPIPTADRAYVIGVIGDYGYVGPAVHQVVAALHRVAPRLDAVVTTGDNAYCCGTAGQVDYAKAALQPLGAPVYPALGNHDEKVGVGLPLMNAFGLTSRWYQQIVGPVEFLVLDANMPADPRQLAWLGTHLARPRAAAFRVVVFHQPGWSCSVHNPEPEVVRRWLPAFKTRVDLVLAGHNHTYERFAATDGTPYVTTGGGGAQIYPSIKSACRGAGHYVTSRTVYHALRLTATKERLTLEAFGTDGKAFDRVDLAPHAAG